MKNIIFIAPPSAGKGTQSKLISEKYNLPHISTGDLLREETSKGTEFGNEIKAIMESGNLVSDDIITKLLYEIKGKMKSLLFDRKILRNLLYLRK